MCAVRLCTFPKNPAAELSIQFWAILATQSDGNMLIAAGAMLNHLKQNYINRILKI